MTEHKHLRVQARGLTGTVELDGVELQKGLRGLTLTLGCDDLPRVQLDPSIVTADVEVGGPLHAVIQPATHELLVALGWTPPGDDCRLPEALRDLGDMLGDDQVTEHLAGRFSCSEAEVICGVLALSGHRDAAARWIAWHAADDGEQDLHAQLYRTVGDGATFTLDPAPARAWVDELWPVTP